MVREVGAMSMVLTMVAGIYAISGVVLVGGGLLTVVSPRCRSLVMGA